MTDTVNINVDTEAALTDLATLTTTLAHIDPTNPDQATWTAPAPDNHDNHPHGA